jgi:pyruvate ferredoxin oxidoreductase gamma subunit
MRDYTRIRDRAINIHSGVTNPEAVVVIDPTLLTPQVLDGLPEDGILIVNSPALPAEIRKKLNHKGGKVATVDATKISLETVKIPMPNTPMLGALVKLLPVVSLEAVQGKIRDKFAKKLGDEKTKANLEAIKRAYNEVKVG